MAKEIGQEPVKIKKELLGFVLNRMQYALMNECWRLISVHSQIILTLFLRIRWRGLT